MDVEAILLNLVRVGTVRAIDASKRKARVWYDDLGILSGWLSVMQFYGAAVRVLGGAHIHEHGVSFENDHTHVAPVDISSAGGHRHVVTDDTMDSHEHSGTTLAAWMPTVGARVLVLYLPVFNGDGFVLGGL